MFSAFGWLEVLPSSDSEESPAELVSVREWVDRTLATGPIEGVDAVFAGGSLVIRFACVHNRASGRVKLLAEFLHDLGDHAPGTYGVIFVRDDDAEEEMSAWVMRRARLSVERDPFFSPTIPTIEG